MLACVALLFIIEKMESTNALGFAMMPRMEPMPQSVNRDSSNAISSGRRSPLKFFLLVFAVSIPFWVIGALTGLQLLPGVPVAALMFVCPATAAVILVYQEQKTAGVLILLKRSVDCDRVTAKIWYMPLLLLAPAVSVLSYGIMLLMGVLLPTPQIVLSVSVALLLAFLVAALG